MRPTERASFPTRRSGSSAAPRSTRRRTPRSVTSSGPGRSPGTADHRVGPMPDASTALLTDHYELTMLQAALAAGTAERRSVFELFGRRLPEGRRYGVVAGVGRALDAIERFRFDEPTLSFLSDNRVVDDAT